MKAVLALLVLIAVWHSCEGGQWCKRDGGGCAGHDFGHHFDVSFDKCQEACEEKAPKCVSFSYHTKVSHCWLKDYTCKTSELTNTASTGGADYTRIDAKLSCEFDYCKRPNKGCAGYDLNQGKKKDSLEDCQKACNDMAECKSLSFYDNTGICWLKKHVCKSAKLTTTAGNDYVKVKRGADCEKELEKIDA